VLKESSTEFEAALKLPPTSRQPQLPPDSHSEPVHWEREQVSRVASTSHFPAPPHLGVCQAPMLEEGRARNMQAIAQVAGAVGFSYPRTTTWIQPALRHV